MSLENMHTLLIISSGEKDKLMASEQKKLSCIQ